MSYSVQDFNMLSYFFNLISRMVLTFVEICQFILHFF